MPRFDLDAVAGESELLSSLDEGRLGPIEEGKHGNDKPARVKKSRFERGGGGRRDSLVVSCASRSLHGHREG